MPMRPLRIERNIFFLLTHYNCRGCRRSYTWYHWFTLLYMSMLGIGLPHWFLFTDDGRAKIGDSILVRLFFIALGIWGLLFAAEGLRECLWRLKKNNLR